MVSVDDALVEQYGLLRVSVTAGNRISVMLCVVTTPPSSAETLINTDSSDVGCVVAIETLDCAVFVRVTELPWYELSTDQV